MKVLLCAADAPVPPVTGTGLVVRELLPYLQREADVRVVALRHPDQAEVGGPEAWRLVPPPAGPLTHQVRIAAGSMLTGRPLTFEMLADRLRGPQLEELDRHRPDVVHLVSGRLAGLVEDTRGVPTVLSALDAVHRNVEARLDGAGALRRWWLRGEIRRVRHFQARHYPRADRVVFVSEEDRAAGQALAPGARFQVIPNGVDLERFRPGPEPAGSPLLVFHGVMRFPPNVVAARELVRTILPEVRRHRPDVRVRIVGRQPGPEVRELAGPGVEVTGEVDDVGAELQAASVYVCPMRSGTGIKNKVLEAMACELPCVVTPLALQGIHARHGQEVMRAETSEDLAQHVVALLDDPDRGRRLGAAARAFVRREHSWEHAAERYLDIYREVVDP